MHIKKIVSERTGKISYRAYISSPQGQISKTFRTKTLARDYGRKIEGNGELLDTYGSDLKTVKLSQAIEQFIPAGKDTCIASRLAWWNAHLGKYKLTQIDRRIFSQTWNKLNVSNATKNGYKADFGTLCKWISEIYHVNYHPHRGISNRPEPKGRERYLSESEQTALLSACKNQSWDKLYLLTLLALTTGARKSELLALTWASISFKDRSAYIAYSKNGYSRVLPLTANVMAELARFRRFTGLIFEAGS